MKTQRNGTQAILLLIITSALAAGCASGSSRKEMAQREALELAQREAAQKEDLRRDNQIAQNWGKLRLGMSAEAVQTLVGGFLPYWQANISFSGSGPIMSPGSIKEQTTTLIRGNYKLVIVNGELRDWSPRWVSTEKRVTF